MKEKRLDNNTKLFKSSGSNNYDLDVTIQSIMKGSQKKYSIVSAPYRISLGGGGTDLPFYASKKEGFLISASIDEYITVLIARRSLDKDLFLQYTETERVNKLDDINHNLFREVLRYFKIRDSFQVATFSSMPTFTGLGSSSTLIVAFVKAFYNLNNIEKSSIEIAQEAFHIEREVMGWAGGFQDQYISALGGIQIIKISKDLQVETEPIILKEEVLKKFQDSLYLVYSGVERSSADIIKAQETESDIINAYDQIKSIGETSVGYIREGNINALGKAMDEHWRIKKKMAKVMSNSEIDEMYITLKSYGSIGGKIIGAGGGGFFLMVVTDNKEAFKRKATDNNFKFVNFELEFKGAHIIS